MLVPTMPRFYTVAEVLADPLRLNSRLGTYTNFVNLLDLAALAVPSGMRGDGLPSSVTLIAPHGADGLLAGAGGATSTPVPARRWARLASCRAARRSSRRRRRTASRSSSSARI